jgi:6-phosphofructo-2-kinase/fructose-2,6-biphosphatase 2
VLVGLPGRGKSFVANKVSYYLNWVQIPCKVFSVANYQRMSVAHTAAEKYSLVDDIARDLRRKISMEALDDIFSWFKDKHAVAVLDGTNVTREFRAQLQERCLANGARVMFVESICNDDQQIIHSIMNSRAGQPNFQEQQVDEIIEHYREKVEYYRQFYQPMDPEADADLCFVRMVDVGRNLFANRTSGYLEMRITRYLLNLHVRNRTIYITRHGESLYNVAGKIGGDSELSPRGHEYAGRLKEFMDK